jgi:hypothetical protein
VLPLQAIEDELDSRGHADFVENSKKVISNYGLGSLVSGYVASSEEREGLVIVAGLTNDGALATLEVHAVQLDSDGLGAIPAPTEAAAILDRFRILSRELADGTFERAFYDEVARGLGSVYLRDVRAAFRQGGVSGLLKKAGRVRTWHLKRLLYKVGGFRSIHPTAGASPANSHD